MKRCAAGQRGKRQRRPRRWASRAQRGRGKKTLLVHHVWGNSRGRTPLLAGARRGAAVLPLGRSQVSGLFAAIAAADDRFWGRGGIWASPGQAQGTLWNRVAGECGADHY